MLRRRGEFVLGGPSRRCKRAYRIHVRVGVVGLYPLDYVFKANRRHNDPQTRNARGKTSFICLNVPYLQLDRCRSVPNINAGREHGCQPGAIPHLLAQHTAQIKGNGSYSCS